MRILGVDPALGVTGYGIVEAQARGVFLIEAGVITTRPKNETGARLQKIYSCINRLIKDTGPEVIVLEKIFSHYRHPTTSFILGQARGVICLSAAINDIALVEYAATRVKKAVVGEGLASKMQVQRMIAQIFVLEKIPKYTDVTDALALAVAHYYIAGGRR